MHGRDVQIAVVYNLENQTYRGDPKDLIAIQYTANTAQFLFNAISSLGYPAMTVAVEDSLEEFEKNLRQFSPENTLVFNNCDGFKGENIGSVRVTNIIENLGFRHTGSTPDTIGLCIDKARAKERLMRSGVPTPNFQVFETPGGDIHLDFPVIIKPVAEDASMGIDLQSVVTNPLDLEARVAYVIDRYQQSVIVEEYIVGREFAVAMWGNETVETLPISEEDFSLIEDPLKCFLTYESKWIETSPYFQNINVRCPALLSEDVERCVKETAIAAYRSLGLRDFGRVDIRYWQQTPYIIDVNEIPDLTPESGFPRTSAIAGYSYEAMVERIIDFALRREGWRS